MADTLLLSNMAFAAILVTVFLFSSLQAQPFPVIRVNVMFGVAQFALWLKPRLALTHSLPGIALALLVTQRAGDAVWLASEVLGVFVAHMVGFGVLRLSGRDLLDPEGPHRNDVRAFFAASLVAAPVAVLAAIPPRLLADAPLLPAPAALLNGLFAALLGAAFVVALLLGASRLLRRIV